MSAHLASSFSFAPQATQAPQAQSGAFAHGAPSSFQRAVQWLLEMPRRRAVINQLDSLSDHELADIGLARADVPRVFDRGFGVSRADR